MSGTPPCSRIIVALFALCIVAAPSLAQDRTPAVDAYIQAEMSRVSSSPISPRRIPQKGLTMWPPFFSRS